MSVPTQFVQCEPLWHLLSRYVSDLKHVTAFTIFRLSAIIGILTSTKLRASVC